MAARSSFLNAFIGAVVTVVLSVVPFSPVLGGAVAGYLEGRDGLRVGALSGAIASLPLLLVLFAVAGFLAVPGGFGLRGALAVLLMVVLAVLFAALYVVGLSAAGGLLGVYLAEDRADRRTAPRRSEESLDDDAAVR